MRSRACLGLDDRSIVFGDKDFIWSLEDFIWSAAVVQINDKVQLARGSGCGFTALEGGKRIPNAAGKMLLQVSSLWVIPGQS